MRHALPHEARPARPMPWLLCALAVALAALPMVGIAHQGVDHKAAASATAPGETAKTLQVQGRVDAIIVTSRVTGQTQRYPVLQLANGERYLLRNADTLPDGATAAVTGRADGRVLFSETARTLSAPQAIRKDASQRKELTGTLRMFHIDYVDGRPAEFGYSLVTDAGQKNIVDLGTLLPMLENGMRATVSGPVDARGYVTVDSIEILAPPATKPAPAGTDGAGPPVALTTGYITLPLKYPNNAAAPWTYNADPGAWPIATITNTVYGAAPAQSVAEYYKEVSYGAQLVSGLVANAGGAWLLAAEARPTACGTSAQLDAVLNSIETQAGAAASAAGYNVGSYTGILYVIDALPCGWAGLGYIGWERSYAKGTASLGVVGHEFGHNFGLYHAGNLDCGAATIATSGCNVTEYGDPFDIMGNQRSMHFAAYQKQLLGYIPGSSVSTHGGGSTTYTLGPIELANQTQYAVRVPTGNASRTYWLEFRQPIGFDGPLSAFPNLGAQVRLARPFEFNNCGGCSGLYDDTQFLDMTPGTASFTDGTLLAGQTYTDSLHNITINVLTATASALTVTVASGGVTATTTTLASSANPSTQGQSVTFTASVTGSAPTGNVAFRESGTPLAGCASVALAGSGNTRTATCAISTLAVGVHSIVADYAGNASNATSSSAPLSQNVKSTTTTTLVSSANPSIVANSVTFTATVTGNGPTGTVAFTSDGATISGCGAVNLAGSGNSRTAACATSSLAVGTHAIVASYAGNSANGVSTSAALSQVVTAAAQAPTTTTLISSANPSFVGNSVTFTATVTGSAPTGAVAFTSDGATITGCGAVNLAGSGNSRTAACATSSLAAGTHAIVASYAGNATNAVSASAPLSQVVSAAGPVASVTTLASNLNPALAGAFVTFTAIVTGVAPTGTVAFTAGGAGIANCGAQNLAGSGNSRTAACSTNALAVGTHAIVASYGGDSGNNASASPSLSQVVNGVIPNLTTSTVTSSANPSPAGSTVALTATVVGNPPVAGGTVSFTANGAPLSGCAGIPVTAAGNARVAVCNAAGLASGAYSIVANYGGNASSQPSVSPVFSQVVPFATIGNTIQFAAATYAANETAGNVVVTVTRIGDVSAPALVGYATFPGTATLNADYATTTGSLSWSAGESSPRTLVIPIVNDSVSEANETFTVTFSSPLGATLGTISTTTVTILDDQSAAVSMPGVATVVQHPYGTLSVQGATLIGDTISNLTKNAVIQLGTIAGTQGSFAKIDFQGLDIGAGNTLTIRSGAPGQTVYLTNVNGATAGITGTLQTQSGNGAAAPYLHVQNPAGLSVNAGGIVRAPSGLTMDTLGATPTTGESLVNQGTIDGGSNLQLFASKVNGGGAFKGNAMVLATFGNLNNPVNGPHFLANGLQLFPGSGADVSVSLAGYGSAPQFINLVVHGNATFSMPSSWPNGSSLPPNNRPVMPGEVRPAGVPDPGYGGGSMIIQATGALALQGGASGDFVFPGGVVFKSGGPLDVNGTSLDNGWTTSGTPFQGVFMEAPSITDSAGSARIFVRTNNVNWANFSPRPLVPVSTWTLQRVGDGSAQFVAADSAAPHLNFYSITSEAGAAGACYTCLVNPQVINLSTAP